MKYTQIRQALEVLEAQVAGPIVRLVVPFPHGTSASYNTALAALGARRNPTGDYVLSEDPLDDPDYYAAKVDA